MNAKVNFYFDKAKMWREEFERLRALVLDFGLEEELKWGHPCYMLEKKNVMLMHGFKDYCALMFFKGALVDDPKGIFVQQTNNVQAVRQIRFTSAVEIAELEPVLKAYIKNAIEVEKSGRKMELKKTSEFAVAAEFQQKLDTIPELKTAFHALTPGRQRGYLLYFSAAKQAKTREARVEKYMPAIMNGKGLEDE